MPFPVREIPVREMPFPLTGNAINSSFLKVIQFHFVCPKCSKASLRLLITLLQRQPEESQVNGPALGHLDIEWDIIHGFRVNWRYNVVTAFLKESCDIQCIEDETEREIKPYKGKSFKRHGYGYMKIEQTTRYPLPQSH
ncbi:hypothetical protein CDAR_82031 [Caerostris darwini]|uniref:Uncharacterized protein n=1 Tax=Caerostris darwini TaxID=1538125 RepID=A0AAV4MX39_9ARAC|nr:hypothetical protein CDAR_82031 [Caerostris darwini]